MFVTCLNLTRQPSFSASLLVINARVRPCCASTAATDGTVHRILDAATGWSAGRKEADNRALPRDARVRFIRAVTRAARVPRDG
jgi:hypothetical protein